MAKYFLQLTSALVILFLAVPFIVSLCDEHAYSLPLKPYELVSLKMPDGENIVISAEEFFSGAAAAFIPDECDEETLRAACVMLNTPSLTKNGVLYLGKEERRRLFGDEYSEKSLLYSRIWESTKGQSLVLSNSDLCTLCEYMDNLTHCSGDYTEKLSALFPEGGLKRERGKA